MADEVTVTTGTENAGGESAAVEALAEVATAAIEQTGERVDELARAREELHAVREENIRLREEMDKRFGELEARIADANFVASTAAETAELAAEAAIEAAEEIEEEIEEMEEVEFVEVGGQPVADVSAAVAEEAPVLHTEAQEKQQAQQTRRRHFIRI